MGQPGFLGLGRLSDIIAEPSEIRWMNYSSEWLISDRHRGIDDPVGDWRMFQSAHALLTMGVLERGAHDEAIVDPALTSTMKDLVAELEN